MKHRRTRIAPESPPPLVPRSLRGWLAPLGRALLAAIGALLCHILVARQAQLLSDSASRHH